MIENIFLLTDQKINRLIFTFNWLFLSAKSIFSAEIMCDFIEFKNS